MENNNNNKTNDWFAARFLNPDIGADALIGNNITAENSTLQSADFYKNKPKVQEQFKKEDGSFDEKSFNEFYNNIEQEYVALSSIDAYNYALDAYENTPGIFSINNGTKSVKSPIFSLVSNPLDQKVGIEGRGITSDPEISMREAAQKNHYFDNETGQWSKETVNEAGFWGLLTGKSLVYATYDEDVFDDNGNLIHQKGEWKIDEFGNYYAETAENKENLDKQFVALSEVLTEDGSAWNTVDLFDTDNIHESIAKSALRAALVIGSTFIPYAGIGSAIKYLTAGISFAKVLPSITKTVNGLFYDGEFDALNRWDNTMKRFSVTKSDEATDHLFRVENLFSLIEDSFMQLAQQRAIAQIPEKLGLTKKATDAANQAIGMQLIGAKASGMDIGENTIKELAKASPVYKAAMKDIKKYSKISHAISMAYLISTSSGEAFNSAKRYGFDNFTSSVISLATMGALGTLFQTDYFRGMLTGSISSEESRRIKTLVDHYLKNNAKQMAAETVKNTSNEAKVSFMKKWGRKISDFIKNHYDEAVSGEMGVVSGAINEGIEETTEEVAMDLAIGLGKGLNEIRSLVTGKEYEDNHVWTKTDPWLRYGTALLGGAIGGAVFKISDRLQLGREGYNAMKQLLENNTEIEKELLSYIAQGKTKDVLKIVNKLEKNSYAKDNIDAITGEQTNDKANSQQTILFSTLRQGINSIDQFLDNNGLKMEYDDFKDIELMRGLRVAWLKDNTGENKVHKSLFNDFMNRVQELSSLKARRDRIAADIPATSKEDEYKEQKSELKSIDDIIKTKTEEVRDLINGKDDSYLGRLMLETNPEILNGIIPVDKDSIAQNLYNNKYDNLPKYLKEEVDKIIQTRNDSGLAEINYMTAWKAYKKMSTDESLKALIKKNIESKLELFDPLHIKNGKVAFDAQKMSRDSSDYKSKFYFLREYITQQVSRTNDTTFASKSKYDDRVVNYITAYLLGNIDDKSDLFFKAPYDDNDAELWIKFLEDYVFKVDNQELYKSAFKNSRSKIQSKIDNEEDLERDDYDWLSQYGNFNVNEEQMFLSSLFDEINSNKFLEQQIGTDGSIAYVFPINPMTGFSIEAEDMKDELMSFMPKQSNIYDLINYIYKQIYGKDIDLKQIIDDELRNQDLLQEKYVVSNDAIEVFNNVSKIFDYHEGEFSGILYSVLAGADEEYNNPINGSVPFGANNFINKALKEKEKDPNLLQLKNPEVSNMVSELKAVSFLMKGIIREGEIAKASVLNTHKTIGIKYNIERLISIEKIVKNLLSFSDPEIKSKAKEQFEGFSIDDNLLNLKDNPLNNEEAFIDRSIKLRNLTYEFGKKWYDFFNSLDEDQKVLLTDNLKEKYKRSNGYTISNDLPVVNGDVETLFNDASLWVFLGLCSINDFGSVSEYANFVLNSELYPLDTQEEIVIDALRFINASQSDVQNLKLFFNETIFPETENETCLTNTYKIDCDGGIGKSKGILHTIFKSIKSKNPNKNIIFVANTSRQISDITKGWGLSDDNTRLISNMQKAISENDEKSFKNLCENSVLFIDECSHLNIKELKTLDSWAGKYNCRIIISGDSTQAGVHNNFSNAFALSSFRLNESLRASSNQSRKNNKEIENWFGQKDDSWFHGVKTESTLYYYQSEDGEIDGIMQDDSLEFYKEVGGRIDVSSFIERMKSYKMPEGSSVLIFTTEENMAKLSAIKDWGGYNVTIEHDIANVQGDEWDYVFTDIGSHIAGDEEYCLDGLRTLKTLLTRPRKACVVKNAISVQIDKTDFKFTVNFEKSVTKPVYTNIFDDSVKEEFMKFKKAVLSKIKIPGVSTVVKPDDVEAIAKEVEDEKEKIEQEAKENIGKTNNNIISNNVVEFSTAFIPKKAIEFFKKRNPFTGELKDEDARYLYMQTRNELLQRLYNQQFENFKLVRRDYTANDMFNLANNNELLGSSGEKNLWLVYNYENEDIEIALFQNLGVKSDSILSVINQNAQETFNEFRTGASIDEIKLTDLMDLMGLTISRGVKPVEFKELKDDSEYISLSLNVDKSGNATVSGGFEFVKISSPQFYHSQNKKFRVALNGINKELSELYAQIYEILQNDTDDSTSWMLAKNELMDTYSSYRSGRKVPKWKAKQVMFPAHRFISFAVLSGSNRNMDTEQLGQDYWRQLATRVGILKNVLSTLKSMSNETNEDIIRQGKQEVIKILSSEQRWDIELIVWQNQKVESKSEVKSILEGIENDKNGQMTSYNISVTESIGNVISKLCYLWANRNKRDPKRKYDLTDAEIDFIHSVFEYHQDAIIQRFKEFFGEDLKSIDAVMEFFAANLVATTEDFRKKGKNGVNFFDGTLTDFISDIFYVKDSNKEFKIGETIISAFDSKNNRVMYNIFQKMRNITYYKIGKYNIFQMNPANNEIIKPNSFNIMKIKNDQTVSIADYELKLNRGLQQSKLRLAFSKDFDEESKSALLNGRVVAPSVAPGARNTKGRYAPNQNTGTTSQTSTTTSTTESASTTGGKLQLPSDLIDEDYSKFIGVGKNEDEFRSLVKNKYNVTDDSLDEALDDFFSDLCGRAIAEENLKELFYKIENPTCN